MEFLDKNDILYYKQYGFRKKRSTCDAIINFTSEVLTCFNRSHMVLALFIDLKKAFDTVPHSLLLKKLECYGFANVELDWFKSYLTKRQQSVVLGRTCSDPTELSVGVAQGALLGVLSFEIFINDLFRSLKYSTSILYADDTTLLISGNSLRFLRVKMQDDLESLCEWLKINRLKLNVQKTKSMLLNVEGLSLAVELSIDGELIETVKTFKFLGVHIDNRLIFENHYKVLYDKLFKVRYVIRSLSRILPRFCLRTLYFAYFDSHLICIVIIFGFLY